MRTRAIFILLLAIVTGPLCPGRIACAQRPESESGAENGSGNRLRPDQETDAGDVLYRRGPDGQPISVPVTEELLPTFGDVLESVAESEPLVPDYFISGLRLDGQVVENRAEVSAEIEIHVVAEDRWLRVPLRFDQALLLRYTHHGEGEAAPLVSEATGEGLTWMLRGQGVHTLTLTLRVPLRKTTNGSQLQLVTPKLSNLFAGELRLGLPGEQFAVQLGEDVQVLGEPRKAGGETEIRASLVGDRVDVRWHPVVEETDPISRTLTDLTLRLRGQSVRLSARQQVRLRQSGLPFVEVRLPTGGFRITSPVGVSDTSGAEERQVRPVAAEREGWVRVPLEGVIGTAVRFDWSFEMPFDGSVSELAVDGLEVAGAADQSGTIAVEGFDRHLLTRQANSGGGVARIGIDELPSAGAFANLAYRFQIGSYRLVLEVDRLKSTFRVTPIYVLGLSEFRTDLTAWFLVSIDEGQVDALSVEWPRFSAQSWDVPLAVGGGEVRRDEVSGDGIVDGNSAGASGLERNAEESTTTRWLLKPARPLANGSEIGLSAKRVNSLAAESDPSEIVLPEIVEGRMLPAVLLVAMADNIQAVVEPQPGLTLTPRTTLPVVPDRILAGVGDRSHVSYELVRDDADAELAINVAMTVQPRQIRTGSVVTVEEVDTDPRVTQTFDFDVTFGRLSSVRFEVPEQLVRVVSEIPEASRSEALRFLIGNEPLPATWYGSNVELTLPSAIRGPFQITIGPYRTPALQTPAPRLDIPIITGVDRPFDSLRLVVADPETVSVRVDAEQWTRLPTIVDGAEWITRSSPDVVTLNLDRTLAAVPQRLSIPLATIRTDIGESGSARTVAQYQLDADCSRVVVRLPDNAESLHFEWDGHRVESPNLAAHGEIPNQFLVARPSEHPGGGSWLSVTYSTRNQLLGWSRLSTLEFPSFGEGITIERTLWEVRLPRSQHLLTRPDFLSPQYAWSRDGVLWSRTPARTYHTLRDELTAQGAAEVFPVDARNVYPFDTLGTLTEVRVRSMSNSLLVFLGAGLTLVASFLVLKVPAARSLWFWLAWGTLGAVLSLWYLEAILLLLQPAAYGLLLPVCAALFDRLTDRKTVSPETLSPRRSVELALSAADDSRPSAKSNHDPAMPSTLVRPTALSDPGVR